MVKTITGTKERGLLKNGFFDAAAKKPPVRAAV